MIVYPFFLHNLPKLVQVIYIFVSIFLIHIYLPWLLFGCLNLLSVNYSNSWFKISKQLEDKFMQCNVLHDKCWSFSTFYHSCFFFVETPLEAKSCGVSHFTLCSAFVPYICGSPDYVAVRDKSSLFSKLLVKLN